jgi:hypothetical protein
MQVKIFPLARPWRRIGKVTELLQQAKRPFSEEGNFLIRILGKDVKLIINPALNHLESSIWVFGLPGRLAL